MVFDELCRNALSNGRIFNTDKAAKTAKAFHTLGRNPVNCATFLSLTFAAYSINLTVAIYIVAKISEIFAKYIFYPYLILGVSDLLCVAKLMKTINGFEMSKADC